jgi:predicted small secreted protein
MRRPFLIVLAVSALLSLSACETAKGLGRDITNGANALDRVF